MSERIGRIQLDTVVESDVPLLSPYEIYPDCTPAVLEAAVRLIDATAYDADRALLRITIRSFVLRLAGLTILVDTCVGNGKARTRSSFHNQKLSVLIKARFQPIFGHP